MPEDGDSPDIGLVIRHLYLWRDEKAQGQEEGRKARPCLIVHKRQNEFDETEVYICPITHTPPSTESRALEIPLASKKRLKLDDDQSWLITNEVNRFTWRGPDVVKTQSGRLAYGYLPYSLTKTAVEQLEKIDFNVRFRPLPHHVRTVTRAWYSRKRTDDWLCPDQDDRLRAPSINPRQD